MRSQRAEHPTWLRNISKVFDSGVGQKMRSDAKGLIAGAGRQRTHVLTRLGALRTKQRKTPWRQHQSLAHAKQGRCSWEGCPGKKASKAAYPRSYDTFMRCEECSAFQGKDVFLCNDIKGRVEGDTQSRKTIQCHLAYHNKYHSK